MSLESHISTPGSEPSGIAFDYRLVSVDRLRELEEHMNALAREGKLSESEIFRGHLRELEYGAPPSFPDARSVIILATFTRLMFVRFHLRGETYDVMMPPQYYSTGMSAEDLKNAVLTKVVGEPGHTVERAHAVQLKSLAVKSGLARYGRNNICYVDGMGSLSTLHAYFTDYTRPEDHWGEMTFMPACRDCRLCIDACPCGCISIGNAVIDVGKCLTLYNEIQGEFPDWISPSAHNALMGCMKCQLCCPANRDAIRRVGRLEDVTEEETMRILGGNPDADLLESLSTKLRTFAPTQSKECFPMLTRNLKALVERPGRRGSASV
jgi:epoxyqueuosine reductase